MVHGKAQSARMLNDNDSQFKTVTLTPSHGNNPQP